MHKPDNVTSFNHINNKFLNPPGATIRHTPIKLYLPSAPPPPSGGSVEEVQQAGRIRLVQSLVTPLSPSRTHLEHRPFISTDRTSGQIVTIGKALNSILPTVFPSTRNPILALPVMHGAVVPMSAPVQELLRAASFTDGFLHIAVIMLG